MRRYEFFDERMRREQEAAARRDEVIKEYGQVLGEAYLGYTSESSGTPGEYAQRKEAFAQAIVNALESRTPEEKVRGIVALLSAFEAKIAPVARRANTAAFRTAKF